jgi:hypothetical protein
MIITQGVVFAGIFLTTTIIGLYAVWRVTSNPSPYLREIDLQIGQVILYHSIPHKILLKICDEKYVTFETLYCIIPVDAYGSRIPTLGTRISVPFSRLKALPVEDTHRRYWDSMYYKWETNYHPPVETLSEKDTPLSRYLLSEED